MADRWKSENSPSRPKSRQNCKTMLNAASQTIPEHHFPSWVPLSPPPLLSSHKPSRSAAPSNQWRSRFVDFLCITIQHVARLAHSPSCAMSAKRRGPGDKRTHRLDDRFFCFYFILTFFHFAFDSRHSFVYRFAILQRCLRDFSLDNVSLYCFTHLAYFVLSF